MKSTVFDHGFHVLKCETKSLTHEVPTLRGIHSTGVALLSKPLFSARTGLLGRVAMATTSRFQGYLARVLC